MQILDLTVDAATVDRRTQLEADVRSGLTAPRRTLPSKWFYDARGSALFEEITRLPEYYQTRTEAQILEQVADEIVAAVRPVEIVELGSGSSRKTRLLLDALHRAGTGDRYVALDVSRDALEDALRQLRDAYPWLEAVGVVGDFDHHLDALPRRGPGLVAFLGSTIGNLDAHGQARFVADLAAGLAPGDAFLLGVDLVKDPGVLEAAYDDAAGVTAAFNRNVLEVLRRELDAEIDVDAFRHVASYDRELARIEMLLRAERPTALRFPSLDLDVPMAAGDDIRTEISSKFTRPHVEGLLAGAGLALARWDTDPDARFALALATPVGASTPPTPRRER